MKPIPELSKLISRKININKFAPTIWRFSGFTKYLV